MNTLPRPIEITCAVCTEAPCECLQDCDAPIVRDATALVRRLLAEGETPALLDAFAGWLARAEQENVEAAAIERAPRALRAVVAELVGNPDREWVPAALAQRMGVRAEVVAEAKRWIAAGGLSRSEVSRGS